MAKGAWSGESITHSRGWEGADGTSLVQYTVPNRGFSRRFPGFPV